MVPGQQGASFPAAETPARRPLSFSRNVLAAKGDLRLQVLEKFLQHSRTQKIGIEFAGFCKLDDAFGDSFIDKIAWTNRNVRCLCKPDIGRRRRLI
jgi:hypothetical protein